MKPVTIFFFLGVMLVPAAGVAQEDPAERLADVLSVEFSVRVLERVERARRSLTVPLLVLGTLVDRGLPSHEAIAVIRGRLAAGASDGELPDGVADVGRSMGPSLMPVDWGVPMEQWVAGVQVPLSSHRPGWAR